MDSEIQKLQKISSEFSNSKSLIFSLEKHPRKVGKVEVLPWQHAIKEVFERV